MIKCNKSCTPCCDFCFHCVHQWMEDYQDGKQVWIKCEPIACTIHMDEEHKQKAIHCSYCEDFHCFREVQQQKIIDLFAQVPLVNVATAEDIIAAINKTNN